MSEFGQLLVLPALINQEDHQVSEFGQLLVLSPLTNWEDHQVSEFGQLLLECWDCEGWDWLACC